MELEFVLRDQFYDTWMSWGFCFRMTAFTVVSAFIKANFFNYLYSYSSKKRLMTY